MPEEVPSHIQEIARAAVAAPSGDNSQPWHFVFKAPDTFEFHIHPEKDHPLLNVDDSGTLIALGAAIENAILEANFQGYEAKLSLHLKNAGSHKATLTLAKGGRLAQEDETLHMAIHQRHSNRKPYKKHALHGTDRMKILAEANSVPGLSVTLVEDRIKMGAFARNLTIMEEVALSNKVLHGYFFKSIFWSDARNKQGAPGLHGKTLELPPPAQALFRILRYWPVAGLLARMGFPRFVAATNADQNASSSAFGAIVSPALDADSYVSTGRLLERIWLQAEASGLSFQIVSGILFLTRCIESGNAEGIFTPAEQAAAHAATASIHELLEVGTEYPIITFRIGYGKPATARSLRMKPHIEVVH